MKQFEYIKNVPDNVIRELENESFSITVKMIGLPIIFTYVLTSLVFIEALLIFCSIYFLTSKWIENAIYNTLLKQELQKRFILYDTLINYESLKKICERGNVIGRINNLPIFNYIVFDINGIKKQAFFDHGRQSWKSVNDIPNPNEFIIVDDLIYFTNV